MAQSRGKIFVERTVQGALVKRVVLHWCAFFALSVFSLFVLEYFTGEPNQTFGGYVAAIWGKYAFFFLLMLATIPSFVYDTLKMSHRFTGPIHRLKNEIRRLADGETVSELKFRDNDFWLELSTDFNRIANRIQETRA